MNITTINKMKQLLIILITTIISIITLFTETSFAQVHYAEKGLLKIGIKVTLDGQLLPLDSLAQGFDPETGIPLNLVIPEKSSLGIVSDSIGETDIMLIVNKQPPTYINRPSAKVSGFSMSSSPGSENSYAFVDEVNNDTLRIAWKVGYAKLELSDLFPAEYFTNSEAIQFRNIFESYPDTSQFNWNEVDYRLSTCLN